MDRPVQRVVESGHRQICRDDVEKVSRANAVRRDNAVGGVDGAFAAIQRGQRSGESAANPLGTQPRRFASASPRLAVTVPMVVVASSAGVGGSQTRSAVDDGRTPAEWGRRAQTE